MHILVCAKHSANVRLHYLLIYLTFLSSCTQTPIMVWLGWQLKRNWRLRWKKGLDFFTQNWTLSKTLQISHAVLSRCVKAMFWFFAEDFFLYEILRMQRSHEILCMQRSLYLWSHQHVTGETVISLIIQQNIDLLQRVTLKSVDFRVKPLQFWFRVNVRLQRL